MRILGIETSSPVGSVALVENGAVVASVAREQEHHEQTLPSMIDAVLAAAGWAPSSLDRLAAGLGPGSFTGLRMGIALLVGMARGLDRPLVGVGSMRAMAAAVPAPSAKLRCPLLDARRGELFVAAYTAEGVEVLAPTAIARSEALAHLRTTLGVPLLCLGRVPEIVDAGEDVCQSPETDTPQARWVATLAASEPVGAGPLRPAYVRDAVAERPRLPRNPLGGEAVEG